MKAPNACTGSKVYVSLLIGLVTLLTVGTLAVMPAVGDETAAVEDQKSCECGEDCQGKCDAAKASEAVPAVKATRLVPATVIATPAVKATRAVPAMVMATPASSEIQQPAAENRSVVFSILRALMGGTNPPVERSMPSLGEEVVADATHQQASIIKVTDADGEGTEVHTFCLDEDGRILAGCGSEPGEIRVYEPDGQFVTKWEVPVTPDAVSVAPNGSICVAGNGKLVRLNAQGKVIKEVEAPHFSAISEGAEEIREQIIASNKQMAERYAQMREQMEEQIKSIQEQAGDEPLDEAAERRVKLYEDRVAMYKQVEEQIGGRELPEEQIKQRVEQTIQRKMRVASISATADRVFITCGAQEGYGFDVWKMNSDFEDAEQIVTGLRGCCGQMDVKVNDNGVYVAENARHRVCCFDHDGEELCDWGKSDRTGNSQDGFGSCCNPMNVAFGPGESVYTAESTTGRIKRFDPKGEFTELIGQVELVPGCKNVSIAVNSDGDRVYMLDITRDHIVLMQRKSTEGPAASTAAAPDAQEAAGG